MTDLPKGERDPEHRLTRGDGYREAGRDPDAVGTDRATGAGEEHSAGRPGRRRQV